MRRGCKVGLLEFASQCTTPIVLRSSGFIRRVGIISDAESCCSRSGRWRRANPEHSECCRRAKQYWNQPHGKDRSYRHHRPLASLGAHCISYSSDLRHWGCTSSCCKRAAVRGGSHRIGRSGLRGLKRQGAPMKQNTKRAIRVHLPVGSGALRSLGPGADSSLTGNSVGVWKAPETGGVTF